MFGGALHPGLPDSIRSTVLVLGYFYRMLVTYLSNVMRERRMSDRSGQSGELSSDDDDTLNYERFVRCESTLHRRRQNGF